MGQILLYAGVGSLAGILFGFLVYYLQYLFFSKFRRILAAIPHLFSHKKPMIASPSGFTILSYPKQQTCPKIEIRAIPAPVIAKLPEPARIIPEPARMIPTIDKILSETAPGLLSEFEQNYKTVKQFSGDNLVSLRTEAWDTSQHALNLLPGKMQNELEHIYANIKALNQIAWFSTEFQRHSPVLHEQYVKLLSNIANKYNELTQSPFTGFTSAE